jgi:hypothetical protein
VFSQRGLRAIAINRSAFPLIGEKPGQKVNPALHDRYPSRSGAPADTWWQGVTNTYELAIEVSTPWRGLGIARQLLSLALEFDTVEEMILVVFGLSWHWDLKDSGLFPFHYRCLLAHILEPYHFFECLTDEPTIGMFPANILLVRIGKDLKPEVMDQLFQRMCFFSASVVRRSKRYDRASPDRQLGSM